MFDEFCKRMKIDGTFKEAFYHHLMAKYSDYENPAVVIDLLKREEYLAEWMIVLEQIYENFMS